MRNHIWAILWKQMKDTFKNKAILIQFLMFPMMTIIMESAMNIEGMPDHFFVNMFATMYIGMAPLVSISSMIAEEKEKNTLRVLHMANVKAGEYLLGNAIYIWLICMAGSLVMGLAGGYRGEDLLQFLVIMAAGHVISIVLGAAIGVFSKDQMSATSMTVPVMLVFSFLPMLSMFNETIGKVAKFFYSQQISLLLNGLPGFDVGGECIAVVLGNVAVIVAVFGWAYGRMYRK
ncbi:MAG: ABC transporter permease [Lachnospiraceae bacterium]|nr:ABC transporter permease [Lachnospiraceae bacterium]